MLKVDTHPYTFFADIPVQLGQAGKRIGFKGSLDVGRLAYLSPRNEEHYYRKGQGFGMDVSLLEELRKDGYDIIVISYVDAHQVVHLRTTRKVWAEDGVEDSYSKKKKGVVETYGVQKFLSKRHFTCLPNFKEVGTE